MQTERFNVLRRQNLEQVFDKQVVINVWRRIVKNQLRNLDIKDLFDNYDFNYNIEERAEAIRNEILNGTFKVGQSLIYRIEKKFGVCRHLVIPQPTDTLVLQVLVESIYDQIITNQPSANAFYSRDKHSVGFPHDVADYGLSFRQQWKALQKKIYKFNAEKDLIIVTDISNYYDSIDICELRKVFTSYAKINEVIVDLLFRLVEEISWKPDYLPYSERGLPTANIEGIRLLAHSFLFEIDDVIKQKTDNCFARWMDDIVIGVNSKKEAVEVISAVSDMLKTRGLCLNLSKTNVYNSQAGYFHFQIDENLFLDRIEKTATDAPFLEQICSELFLSFESHLRHQQAKYWDKVAKRYITTFSKFRCEKLLDILPNTYVEHPVLRNHLLMYLNTVGYKRHTCSNVLEILESIDVFDDISLYQLCYLITKWTIPVNEEAKLFLSEFEKLITDFYFKQKTSSIFYSILWFKAKYSHPQDLLTFIKIYENVWQRDSFLRRQVTATLTRLFTTEGEKTKKYLFNQISSGIINTVTLANQIFQFVKLKKLDRKLTSYLFPENSRSVYPLEKFLVLCSILNSTAIRNDYTIRNKIKEHIKDRYYLKWIDVQYDIC